MKWNMSSSFAMELRASRSNCIGSAGKPGDTNRAPCNSNEAPATRTLCALPSLLQFQQHRIELQRQHGLRQTARVASFTIRTLRFAGPRSALMVLDTSAVFAILQNEPERRKFNEAIEVAETRSPT